MSAAPDPAAEIAKAICEDTTLPWHTPAMVGAEIARRWPGADHETIRRAVTIAVELTLCDPPEGSAATNGGAR